MNSLTIKLGEQDYVIKEFTLGTLENVQAYVMEDPGGVSKNPRGESARNINILSSALVQDHPDLTPDVLRGKRLGGTIQSVAKAVNEVLRFGGFLTEEAAPAGEASPGEDPARAEPTA
jgi:hypothetical protein